jgi:hypothetical protein
LRSSGNGGFRSSPAGLMSAVVSQSASQRSTGSRTSCCDRALGSDGCRHAGSHLRIRMIAGGSTFGGSSLKFLRSTRPCRGATKCPCKNKCNGFPGSTAFPGCAAQAGTRTGPNSSPSVIFARALSAPAKSSQGDRPLQGRDSGEAGPGRREFACPRPTAR